MNNARFSAVNIGPLGCLFTIGLLVLMGWLLYRFYILLWYASPVFFLLALAINWRVPAAWGRRLLDLVSRNAFIGLFSLLGAVIFFPFTAMGMFFNTLAQKRIERMRAEFFGTQNPFFQTQNSTASSGSEGEYVDFEEIESTPKNQPSNEEIDLPPAPEKQPRSNPYNDFFNQK